jgi:hypothetical protein
MTNRRPLDERELERWRRDNRYRLSYRPDLEPPHAHVSLPHPSGRWLNGHPEDREVIVATLAEARRLAHS